MTDSLTSLSFSLSLSCISLRVVSFFFNFFDFLFFSRCKKFRFPSSSGFLYPLLLLSSASSWVSLFFFRLLPFHFQERSWLTLLISASAVFSVAQLNARQTKHILPPQESAKNEGEESEPRIFVSCLSFSLFQVEAGEVDSPLIQVDSLLSACQSSKVYRLLGSCFFRGSCLVRQSDFDRKMREEWNERVNEEREREVPSS